MSLPKISLVFDFCLKMYEYKMHYTTTNFHSIRASFYKERFVWVHLVERNL